MDFYSSYLTGVNQIIGQNGRFARQFQANQKNGGNTATGNTSTGGANAGTGNGLPGDLNPMLLMMLMQFLQMMTGGSAYPLNTNQPYVSGLFNGGGYPTQPNYNNPALTSLESRFSSKAVAEDPNASAIDFTDEDVEGVRADLKAGKYTTAELGQALKYELDQGTEKNLGAITKLITDLTDSGDLNVTPFLQNDYLQMLKPDRQDALLSAIQRSGLRMDDGKPNARLIGFTLDTLSKPGDPATKAILTKFLQNFYNAYGQQPDTPVGKILAQMLALGSITADESGQLVFPGVKGATAN